MVATRSPEAFSSRETDVSTEAVRAPRYALHLPLRYRVIGEPDWRQGRTENISRSGLLFLADGVIAIDTRLEMRFVLPTGQASPGVVCYGRIVRTVPPSADDARPGLAATIGGYRF